ncbi:bifunctional glutamate N-acetyltransferase/amino-acid acetyltransferase ArgJ [Lentibacillus sp. N15]|uniref:bifunctional glutamate N-acetyltransferase/amino-acid acetyltransferase ArgJ n=1 Tax=Lentibacillus songyuanensis TaxID=3136161 RepID=UPI0031BBA3DD
METQLVQLSEVEGSITSAKGFHAGGLHCGIKYKRDDLGWLYSEVPATTAAVFTTNVFQAAPLQVTKESIATEQKIQGLLVNSGVANACTGDEGLQNAYDMRHLLADKLAVADHLVAVNSTGVIGDQLPMEKLKAGVNAIDFEKSVSADFSKAILTTDTFTKHACVQLELDSQLITIGGTAKGSGMINPNMATMLSFITTDAAIEPVALDSALRTAVNQTFNCITIDGDTSTNDTVMVMANGLAANETITLGDQEPFTLFTEALTFVCQSLAKQIARDGEGATKLIEVQVTGAASTQDARKVGKAIVGSSLVKTAVFGADANWGRIICAMGYSDAAFDPGKLSISLGQTMIIDQGLPIAFDESKVHDYLQQHETITILANLNSGSQEAMAWGCDLSYDYVKINASYRT